MPETFFFFLRLGVKHNFCSSDKVQSKVHYTQVREILPWEVEGWMDGWMDRKIIQSTLGR